MHFHEVLDTEEFSLSFPLFEWQQCFPDFPGDEVRYPLCVADRLVVTVVCSASIFSQILIGVDQHLAVLQPLHYHRRINTNKCLLMCLASWLASAVFGILDVSVAVNAKSASGDPSMRHSTSPGKNE